MRKAVLIALAILIAAGVALYVAEGGRGRPARTDQWSTAVYTGKSPFALTPLPGAKIPALEPGDFPFFTADDVADPFARRKDGTWYLFCEVVDRKDGKGKIACATSADARGWTWRGVVLEEPFHLSYPYVFEWEGQDYMIPETRKKKEIRLYRAVSFPDRWEKAATLVKGPYRDSSIVRYADRWWIFAGGNKDTLHLFYAENLFGPWKAHAKNPVKKDPRTARPGGRMIVLDGKLYRYAQERAEHYGQSARVMEITELTPTAFAEKEALAHPVIEASGEGWNAYGMHNVDPHKTETGDWLCVVDGCGKK